MYIHCINIISPWKNLNCLYTIMLCTFCPVVLGQNKNCRPIFTMSLLSSLRKHVWHHFINIKFLYPRTCSVMFCWNWPSGSKKTLKSRHHVFTMSPLSPFEKDRDPAFEHNWIPLIYDCFVPFDRNWLSDSRKDFHVNDRNGQNSIRKALELSTQVS